MITWSFRAQVATIAMLALAACEDGQGGSFLTAVENAASSGKPPVTQAQMAFGAATLVAPDGFCIDQNNLRPRFALMARCDTLGAPSAAGGAPLGIITASFSPAGETTALPNPEQTAAAFDLENISNARTAEDSVIFRANGTAPSDDLGDRHWRGTARIGSQIVGLALYGPEGGFAVSGEGRAILQDLIRRSEQASEG